MRQKYIVVFIRTVKIVLLSRLGSKLTLPVGLRDLLDIPHGGTSRCMVVCVQSSKVMENLFYVSWKVSFSRIIPMFCFVRL